MSAEDLVEGVRAAVDALLAALPRERAGELQELVVGLARERDRLAVGVADVVQAWEQARRWCADGSLRASAALARDPRCSTSSAKRELRRARRLAELPAVRAGVLAGRISLEHADLLCGVATDARRALFDRDVELLVGACADQRRFDDAVRAVRYWADRADDELGCPPKPSTPSRLYAWRHGVTGDLFLDGQLGALDGEIVVRELDRLARQLRDDDRRNGITRTAAQRRAAALVQMATRSHTATGTPARPLFQVIVGDDTARRLCELSSGVVVTPHDLVPHVDTAVMEVFLFDGPTTIISASRRRTFTGALRRAIQVRDRRCGHPSVCDTPAEDCDVDHIVPASRGGPTCQENGRIRCCSHNRDAERHDHHTGPPPVRRRITRADERRARIRWRRRHGITSDDEPPV